MSGGSYFLREAFRQAWRQRLLSLVAVSALGLATLFAGAWGLLWRNARHWQASLGEATEISAYLRPGAKAAAQGAALDAARALSGVASVSLVSEAEAAAQLSKDPAVRQALELLGENPLPATLKLRLVDADARSLKRVSEALLQIPEVEEVDSGEGAVESLLKASRALRTVLLGLGALFSAAALLIVAAVLRLAAWSRRQELGIMRLVGAGHAFIRAPFIIEGFLHGIVGGLAASAALAAALAWLTLRLRSELQVDLAAFLPFGVDGLLAAALALGAGLFGMLGAALGLATVTLAYEDEDKL
jgi:cell division transport system permease protein